MHLWGHFDVTLKVFWAYEADFEVTLGHSGATLGSLLDTFGSLGGIFGHFWATLAAQWSTLGHFGIDLGVTLGSFLAYGRTLEPYLSKFDVEKHEMARCF